MFKSTMVSCLAKRKNIMVASLVGLASLVAIHTVEARTSAADIGRPVTPSDAPCFTISFSSITNSCADTRQYEIPLLTDSSGSKTVRVNVTAADATANQICCQAVGTDMSVTTVTRSQLLCNNTSGTQVLTLTGVVLQNSGRMFVNCAMHPGAVINTVDWNQ